MRKIGLYTTIDGKCPVAEFMDSLSSKQAKKVSWVLELITELDVVPITYFKKLVNTDGIWEIRAQVDGNIFRLLGFMDMGNLIVLNHGFQKKTQKTPAKAIEIAQLRRKDYLSRKNDA